MTDSNVSELRCEISKLNTHLADLARQISRVDMHLRSIDGTLERFGKDFFGWAVLCLPLVFVYSVILKHI